jgi:hypothetical protein
LHIFLKEAFARSLSSRVDEGAQEIGAMLFADAHGFNRSGFLVHAAKKVMETESS